MKSYALATTTCAESGEVRSRWGNHHHPVTPKTFRYPIDRIAPPEAAVSEAALALARGEKGK
jgi:hypothetical protein